MDIARIELSRLRLNPHNDRHGTLKDEGSSIQWLLENRKAYMRALSQDLAKTKRLFERPLVRPESEEFFVFNGNRRTACIKLLVDPRRCCGDTLAKCQRRDVGIRSLRWLVLLDCSDARKRSNSRAMIKGSIVSYVFLSHSHADKAFAKRLAADLRNAGHSVWIDEAEINIGDSLIGKIREGLDQVDFVCAILSKASVGSRWVEKELEIASNREIDEKKVIVLPLLVEDVPLPGFLKGKLYGDFRDEAHYDEAFPILLRSLGPSLPVITTTPDELAVLKKQLDHALAVAKQHEADARRASQAAFRSKSAELRSTIEEANKKFPEHAPINETYAFQMDGTFITLDYALWAIAKAGRRGSHPLEALLTIDDRWGDLENMLEAYGEMLARKKASSR